MKAKRLYLVRTVAALSCTAVTPALLAQGYGAIDNYDAREVALLPRYCIHTQLFRDKVPGGNNQAEIKRWSALMGPAFNGMHHYCWGLMKTNRALVAKAKHVRDHYLADAIGEFDYVLRDAPADFVLRPEILTKKGQNLLRLGRAGEGVAELQQAIDLKPDYWPPYAAVSDYFRDLGNHAIAREWLEKGLARAPDAKPLQTRLSEIMGHKKQKPPTMVK